MHRAFVIQLATECEGTRKIQGRVEHIRSGEAIHFDGLEQLAEFLNQSLRNERLIENQEREAAGE